MQVEVNEVNIDKFDLVKLTGNSREVLLEAAKEAESNGTVLSCRVPDELVLEQNVFDVYESEHVDPARLQNCGYETREDVDNNTYQVCVLHGKTSRHDLNAYPTAPCLLMDPAPADEVLKAALDSMEQKGEVTMQPKLGSICVYKEKQDPHDGTIYICKIHGKPSKHDVTRLPNQPCLIVDPRTAEENDPHRP